MNDEILRIAVASSEGGRVDRHFGHAEDFMVFDVSKGSTTLVERRAVRVAEDGDKREAVCRLLSDCRVLLIEKIGVSPKAKLAAAGIQAIDAHAGKAVDAALAEVFASINAPSNA